MTQQDESGQGTAADQPSPADQRAPAHESAPLQQAPPRPSPYLDAGASVPQAYLAPARPGQPRYGTPAAYRPGLRPFGAAQQPPGQQGYGQSGYGQPGYGRPASGRGGFGLQSRRDPAIAGPWERLVASILDWLIIFTASVLVFLSPLLQLWRDWQAIVGRYPNLYSPAAQAAIGSLSRNPATEHTVLYWFLGMFGMALAYFWVQHAAWGATIGKRVLGTRVVSAADRAPIGVRAAGLRAGALLVGPAAYLLLASPLGYLGGLLWLGDTGLSLFNSRLQCLHDKLAGTIVVRQRWLDQQARSARPW
jgi:uncharacterized RDD family membrane protein YckC